MRIFLVHADGGTVLFRESNFLPRVGDKVASFDVRPFPVVTDVILWPENHHLKEFTDMIERSKDPIDAVVFVK